MNRTKFNVCKVRGASANIKDVKKTLPLFAFLGGACGFVCGVVGVSEHIARVGLPYQTFADQTLVFGNVVAGAGISCLAGAAAMSMPFVSSYVYNKLVLRHYEQEILRDNPHKTLEECMEY